MLNNDYDDFYNQETDYDNSLPVSKYSNQDIDETTRAQLNGFIEDVGRGIVNSIQKNADDYRRIEDDDSLSSVDKALAKRKLLASDIGISIGAELVTIVLTWFAKYLFARKSKISADH